jgi:integrase
MARTAKDTKLDSRNARLKLEARGKPYFRSIDPGLHLGYRRLAGGAGTWTVRLYEGDQDYATERLGTADDSSDANGADILSFSQAQAKARQIRDQRSMGAAGIIGPYTVRQALTDYFEFLRHEGRPEHLIDDAEQRATSLIGAKLGDEEVATLTAEDFRKWRNNLVKAGARTRSGKGPQRHRPIKGDDGLRARQNSANRIWSTFRAALNHAFAEGKVASDKEWRRVKPFKGVGGKRTDYLTVAEAKRLINACDPDFRFMVQAALLTGGRYGSLANLRVRDFRGDTVTLRTRKGNGTERAFPVSLTADEGVPFFERVCAGRDADELMFIRDDGEAWGKNFQTEPMAEACKRAKIKPVGFNQLRHTWASLAVMAGTPLLVVAENLGHTSTRMVEEHYKHLAPSYVGDVINKSAPRFGIKPDSKVAALQR